MPSKIERVYNAMLKVAGKSVTAREIAIKLHMTPAEVGQAFRNLCRLGRVERIEIHTRDVKYLWKLKEDGE